MKKLKEIGLDLIVVFIGVFAAFLLNDLKESRQQRLIKINYFKSFKQELTNVNAIVISFKGFG